MKKLTMVVALLTLATVFVSAQNIIKNGDFSGGLEPWVKSENDGGKFDLKVTNGEMEIAIAKLGKVEWGCQPVYSIPLTMTKGVTYKMSFDAYSTVARVVKWRIQQDGGSYIGYGGDDFPLSLTPQKQHFEFTFTMKQKTDAKAKFAISCGVMTGLKDAPHSIFFDNFVFEEVK